MTLKIFLFIIYDLPGRDPVEKQFTRAPPARP